MGARRLWRFSPHAPARSPHAGTGRCSCWRSQARFGAQSLQRSVSRTFASPAKAYACSCHALKPTARIVAPRSGSPRAGTADLPSSCAPGLARRGGDRCRSGVPGNPCRRRLVRHCNHTGLDRPHPTSARIGSRPRRRRQRADHAAWFPGGLHHRCLPCRRSRRAHHGSLAAQKPQDDAWLHPTGQAVKRQPLEAPRSIASPGVRATLIILEPLTKPVWRVGWRWRDRSFPMACGPRSHRCCCLSGPSRRGVDLEPPTARH